jgi:ATP-binding cassette subfamily F protein 3
MVISHDREFLDGTVDHVLHLEQEGARLYAGNYSDFERQRAERLHQQQAAHVREQAERAHLQAFVDRFRAKATKARQAQSRVKRLERLAGTEAVRAERAFEFRFPEPERVPQSMLQLEHADAGYPPAARILDDVRFGVQAGDRIGLLGPNGAGKSTLVKTLVGELPVLAGERRAHKDVVIGYFAQHTVESLRAGDSAYDHLRDLAPDAPPQVLRDWLGKWHFMGDRAFEPIDGFSGGERARLALSLIAWRKPNVLVLDEPTNHLDLDMRGALADALNDYPGALVLVAHDRHLLGLVCDSFWRVADGRVEPFDGDLDDYARWLRGRGSDAGERAQHAAPQTLDPRERRREAAAERDRGRALHKRLEKIEARVAAIDAKLADLQTRLADPEIYAGPTAVLAEIGREQNALRAEKTALESEWMEDYAALEGTTA